jgi:hypothetical protein
MMPARSVILATLLLAPTLMAGETASAQQVPAHRHGAASLQVSLAGPTLHVALEGPADNFLGFEHAPRTEAQKKAVADAQERLQQPAQLVATPPPAECRAQPARVDMKLPAAGSSDKHSEIEAEWRWECGKPDALTHVDAGGLFRAFPRLKQLDVQIVTDRGQKRAVLKPGAARLKIAA